MIWSISPILSLSPRLSPCLVNCVSVSSTPHNTEHTSSNGFAVLWRFVRFHFFLLSCSFLFDSVEIVGTFMPRRTWLLALAVRWRIGTAENCALHICTTRSNVETTEYYSCVVYTIVHHTAVCRASVSVIWIRRILGRRTEPTHWRAQ